MQYNIQIVINIVWESGCEIVYSAVSGLYEVG